MASRLRERFGFTARALISLLLLPLSLPAQSNPSPPNPLKIAFVSAEVKPFASTGGLGNVIQELPVALRTLGHEVVVVMPLWHTIDKAKHNLVDTGIDILSGKEQTRLWKGTLDGKVDVYFLDNPEIFSNPRTGGLYLDAAGKDYADFHKRHDLLSRGALEALEAIKFQPDVLHANDHHTGALPWYAKNHPYFRNAITVFEIHNVFYQGKFEPAKLAETGLDPNLMRWRGPAESWGKVNPLKLGITQADLVMTVSPNYAREMLGWRFGGGMEDYLQARNAEGRLVGVLNGVDRAAWDPKTDPLIWQNYDASTLDRKAVNKEKLQELYFGKKGVAPDVPLITTVTRLTEQKGMEEMAYAIEQLAKRSKGSATRGSGTQAFQYVLLGSKDGHYDKTFERLAKQYPDRFAFEANFSPQTEHRLLAAADIYFMPSRWEPSGLPQMYSQFRGVVPVVSAVGGLVDSVTDFNPRTGRGQGPGGQRPGGTGFVFDAPFPTTSFSFTGSQFQSAMNSFFHAREKAGLEGLTRAIELYRSDPAAWRQLQLNGMSIDNSWTGRAAPEYIRTFEEVRVDKFGIPRTTAQRSQTASPARVASQARAARSTLNNAGSPARIHRAVGFVGGQAASGGLFAGAFLFKEVLKGLTTGDPLGNGGRALDIMRTLSFWQSLGVFTAGALSTELFLSRTFGAAPTLRLLPLSGMIPILGKSLGRMFAPLFVGMLASQWFLGHLTAGGLLSSLTSFAIPLAAMLPVDHGLRLRLYPRLVARGPAGWIGIGGLEMAKLGLVLYFADLLEPSVHNAFFGNRDFLSPLAGRYGMSLPLKEGYWNGLPAPRDAAGVSEASSGLLSRIRRMTPSSSSTNGSAEQ